MKSFKHYLEELWISPNNGAKYGQVIFLVGGAASGKSTAIRKYINATMYKVLNPDDVKELIVKAGKRGLPAFSSISDADPNSPEGSQKIHSLMRDTKISSKKARTMMKGLKGSNPNNLPNLMFDRTFSFAGEFKKISRSLINAGYHSNNIHIVYVMTDVDIALKRNRERSRTLPDDVIVQSAKGAKMRFTELFYGRAKGAVTNGDWHIIFNRGESAMQVKKAGQRPAKVDVIALKVAEVLGLRYEEYEKRK
jgi:predicted kinase